MRSGRPASSPDSAAGVRREGRYLEAHFQELTVISVYLPSGSAGSHRQASKFRFLESFLPHLGDLRKRGREVVLCGDWNIAHREIDLTNWRSNRNRPGFLPEEREWLTRVFDELGFVDVFRRLDPRPERYTWWSNRGNAWANNVGGASTTRSQRPASRRRRAQRPSTRTGASRTTRRS
jgi:exodeoxyribonuclease-3